MKSISRISMTLRMIFLFIFVVMDFKISYIVGKVQTKPINVLPINLIFK